MFRRLIEDKYNFNYDNNDEKKVLEAYYYSAYKRTLIIKVPLCNSGLSIGIIFLGAKVKDENLVKHEYGHRIQFKKLGVIKYIREVLIPSVKSFFANKKGRLEDDYYSLPWEAEADLLGGVKRNNKI